MWIIVDRRGERRVGVVSLSQPGVDVTARRRKKRAWCIWDWVQAGGRNGRKGRKRDLDECGIARRQSILTRSREQARKARAGEGYRIRAYNRR